MKNFKSEVVFLSALLCVFANAVPLQNDTTSIAAFTGVTTFNMLFNASVLNVDVEYAVFAPGQYTGGGSFSANDYVYAYQIFNDLSPLNFSVDFFSVGIPTGGSINSVATDAAYGISGGINPTYFFATPQSAGYLFMPVPLGLNQHSTVLLFSSSGAPTWGFGTVSGAGLSDMSVLPVPEPATIAMLIPAILALRNKRNGKK